ncbi:MAG TPA: hypothetical protein VHW71_02470 [Steroidobacteraceae bacterium]|nr:hypothetical protein [Steroidobacteraceae bacterium]
MNAASFAVFTVAFLLLLLAWASSHAVELHFNLRAPPPAPPESQAQPPDKRRFVVHNIPQSCSNLKSMDQALKLSTQESLYFFGQWVPSDYDVAVRWASACASYGDPGMRDVRIQFLQERKTQEINKLNLQREENEAAETRRMQAKEAEARRLEAQEQAAEQTAAQQAAEQAAEEAKQRKASAERQRCHQSSQYALYQAEDDLVWQLEKKTRAAQDLARQKKIGEISGAVDLNKQYDDGESIVRADEEIKILWPKYKSLGGDATSPDAVHHTMRSPCGKEQQE